MAPTGLEDRNLKVNNLKSFINSVDERLKIITDDLNWSYETLCPKGKSLTISCSVHPEHEVTTSRIKEHEERCQWLERGYHLDDTPFPENESEGSFVVFTPQIQEMVIRKPCSQGSEFLGEEKIRDVPQTSARLNQDFSRDERLLLYDYVIANTKGQKLYEDMAKISMKDNKNVEKVMTPLEIAAAERDAKRRRASYRNKIHTNRKTQIELLREVIESQMEAFKEEITDQSSKKKEHREEYDSSHRRESHNSRSKALKTEYSAVEYPKQGSSKHHKKICDDKDQRKHFSDRDSKHKNKKNKKSRSRSRSREKSKLKSKHRDYHSSH